MRASDVKPMLAETREEPFSKPGWIFELKLDGWRVIAAREDGKATLYSRNGHDLTASFPETGQGAGSHALRRAGPRRRGDLPRRGGPAQLPAAPAAGPAERAARRAPAPR